MPFVTTSACPGVLVEQTIGLGMQHARRGIPDDLIDPRDTPETTSSPQTLTIDIVRRSAVRSRVVPLVRRITERKEEHVA